MATTSILIFLLLPSVMLTYADWILYVQLKSYSNPNRVYGTEAGGSNRYCCCTCPSTCCSSNVNSLTCSNGGCNTRILICANQGSTAQSCVYSNVINNDTVNFGQGNVAGGLNNPVEVTVRGPILNTNIQVNIEVIDDNGISSTVNPSRILNTQASLQSPQVSGTFSSDKTVNEGGSNVISLSYATRIECATNYYQSDCSVYCIPTNDTTGHYTCDTNGNKICLPGYTNTSKNCLDKGGGLGGSVSCNDTSSDNDSWTLIGIMTTTIANVLLNVIVLMTLLMICICYFTCKTKSTTTNNMELTNIMSKD